MLAGKFCSMSPVILKAKTKPAKTERVNSVVLVTADGSTASLC